MAASEHPFVFICGPDDYLVSRAGKECFEQMVKEAGADDYSREIISGFAGNVAEVEQAVGRFRESVQTMPMFGGRRVIWFKDINFLADSVTGRAEGTLTQVEDMQALLGGLNPADLLVLVTATPVDKRRSFLKWCEKTADFRATGGDGDNASEAMYSVVMAEAKSLGTSLGSGAAELLVARTGANTRLIVEEVRKLSLYAGEGKTIEEQHVEEMTPNVAEGDFFETAEEFFKGGLERTLEALHRHFFTGGDSRPLLAALQNRNRILIQVRSLVDSEEARLGPRGLDGLPKAKDAHAHRFGAALPIKSNFNVFSQHPFYVSKLVQSGKLPTLRRLIDNQREFIQAFEALIGRNNEQEEVMREMVIRCLSPK